MPLTVKPSALVSGRRSEKPPLWQILRFRPRNPSDPQFGAKHKDVAWFLISVGDDSDFFPPMNHSNLARGSVAAP